MATVPDHVLPCGCRVVHHLTPGRVEEQPDGTTLVVEVQGELVACAAHGQAEPRPRRRKA